MAITHFTISKVSGKSTGGSSLPVISSNPEGAPESLTPSGTSQQTDLAVPEDRDDCVWSVTTDVDVFVKFGADPTAAQGEDHLILAGQTRDFLAIDGDIAAVILKS